MPSFRINCNHAFEHVVLDYTEPVFYKNENKQSTKLLPKWITNNENLQHDINEHEIDFKPTGDYHKVLRLNWDYKIDEFSFDFSQRNFGSSKPGGIGEAIDCAKFSLLDKLLRVTYGSPLGPFIS